jgi:Arc/MetJ-type ribon-helix-helix transcriptional regulator
MARPRIDGMDERMIEAFLKRGIYSSYKDVIHHALKALVRQQQMKESAQEPNEPIYSEDTYLSQLKTDEADKNHAAMGNLARKTAVR